MGVKLVPFNFENLAHLDDGRIDKLLKAHVARAIHALSRQVVEIVSKSGCPVFLGAH